MLQSAAIEEDKRDLINREIGKFRKTAEADEQKKEKEKDRRKREEKDRTERDRTTRGSPSPRKDKDNKKISSSSRRRSRSRERSKVNLQQALKEREIQWSHHMKTYTAQQNCIDVHWYVRFSSISSDSRQSKR